MSKSETPQTDGGVVALLKAKKAELEAQGTGEVTLPITGVTVTFPRFKNHGRWQRAQRMAKRDHTRAQTIYLVDVCRFNGERLTIADYDDLIPVEDTWELLGEVFGDDEDDGEDQDGGKRLN